MSTSELERRLGEVLRLHAEDAMTGTDTRTSLETLQRGLAHDGRHRPRAVVAGALAIAASLAIGGVLFGNLGDDPGSVDKPAGVPDDGRSVVVATEFMDRLAAVDFDGMTAYLADDAVVTLSAPTRERDELLRQVLWSSAAGLRIVSRECAEQAGSADQSVVTCAFEYHGLGSDRLGRGPYDATFQITVEDDHIVSAAMSNPYETNGFQDEMWDPFAYWIATRHSRDGTAMYADWPDFSLQAMDPRSTRLWAERVQEYVQRLSEDCECPL